MEQIYRRPERTSGDISLPSFSHQTSERIPTQTSVRKKRLRKARNKVKFIVEQQDQLWFDSWYIEIAFFIICVACFIAIGIVLKVFDGRTVPTLPGGLTMNAIIAVLSTASKSSLVLVIASSIGQSWVWFRQTRRLDDAQLFEDASRGPFGCFQLLWRHRGASFACIGAAIVVLASLFEPSTQQILTFVPKTVQDDSKLAVANQARLALVDPNFNQLYRATQAGIWADNFTRQLSCPGGNCTWDTFPSLSMCSKCGMPETPPKLEFCTWSLDSPANLSETVPYWDASSAYFGQEMPTKTVLCNVTFVDEFPSQISVDIYYECRNRNRSIATPDTDSCTYQITCPDWATYSTDFDIGRFLPRSEFPIAFPTDQSILGVRNPMIVLAKTMFYLDDSLTSLHVNNSATEVCVLNYCLQDYTISMQNGQRTIEINNTRYGDTYYATR